MSQSPGMRVVDASDRSLLLILDDRICEAARLDVLRLTPILADLPGVTNVHPAYSSILIDFDPRVIRHAALERRATEALLRWADQPLPPARTIEIPVRYGGEWGPDLASVSALTGLSPEEVIAIHSGADYLVYFLGFSPGFPYLGGLPESIAIPRLETPRRRVPAGSVAIGGSQTGVYPLASPGGWRIIGRTDLKLFDPAADPPTLLQMGDHIRFVPVEDGRP